MWAYFSKAENGTSEAMKQATKQAHVLGKTNVEKEQTVARTCSKKRGCWVQEAE